MTFVTAPFSKMSLISDLVSAAVSDNPEKQDSPVNDTTGATTSGLVNSNTGLLSKAIDTALDVAATKLTDTKTVGSVSPTGQVSPEAAASQASAKKTGSAASTSTIINGVSNKTLYIGLGIGAVVLIGIIVLATRKH